ncbi:MAG: copper amine oxidase N-terminal domain-containing protein [Clostridiales bacterium]|nr:copper amine oxidase N-terminal domain-containing protein [Clostridiales bacterium]
MKKAAAVLAAAAIFAAAHTALAGDTASVYLNGVKQDLSVPVYEIDGNTMVPIRPIFELAHYKVEWDEMRRRISTTTMLGSLKIQIGSTLVAQNGNQPYLLSTYPRIYNGTTMIPMDFASAATGYTIQYSAASDALFINEL